MKIFPRSRPWLRLIWLCIAALACLPLPAAEANDRQPWVAAWTTSLQAIPQRADLPPRYRVPDVAGRTFRQIVYPTLAGQQARLRFSNRYGLAPLDIRHARIAAATGAAAATLEPGADITFAGRPSVSLAPGAEADSDPIPIALHAGRPYAVSLYLGPDQRLQAWHRVASQASYLSEPGDHSADGSGASFRAGLTQFAWITALSVPAPSSQAVIAVGDSITDGMASTPGRNRRWPDELARRIGAARHAPMAVLNAGISGNRLLSDSPCYGESLRARFEREIAGAPGVRTAIVLIGINDINFAAMPPRPGLDCDEPHTQVSAASLIAGYQELAGIARRHDVRLLLGTLTPADLPPAREAIRAEINRWIRENKIFNHFIDFDAALRDPARPQRLLAPYDSGDHIHPSDAGYAAMARAVPLELLQ